MISHAVTACVLTEALFAMEEMIAPVEMMKLYAV
jgi:hypothetical protein